MLRHKRATSLLRKVLAAPDSVVDEARRDALEEDLLARFDRREHATANVSPFLPLLLRRVAVASAVAMASVTACRVPVDYSLDVGERLAVLLPASARSDVDVEAMVALIERRFGPEELQTEVRIERTMAEDAAGSAQGGTLRIQWGWVGDASADDVWAELVGAFPVIASARTEVESLESVVEGTLGGFLSHEMLDIVIDEQGVEAAKAMILADLAARGLDGTAHIEVDEAADGSGQRKRVEVRVSAESAGSSE